MAEKILFSLDSSYSYQNFTLLEVESKKNVFHYGEDRGRKSLEIFPKIFEDLNVDINKVDIFAVDVGIGYSTSLRVGITLVKTYAQILKKPLVTYSNFECLLEFAPDEGKYLTLLKVSRYWVYGIWEKTKEGSIEIQKPTILDEEKIKSLKGEHLRVIYPAWLEGSKEIIQKLEIKDKPIEVPIRGFSEVGALVALRKYQNGQTVHPFEVEPIYFRSAV